MYKIEQEFVYGWEHASWSNNLYETSEAAHEDIDAYIEKTVEAHAHGAMSEAYDRAEFRVVHIRTPIDAFSTEEQVILLEAARIALADADMADCIVSSMDLDDDTFCDIRDRLCKIMGDSKVEAGL